MSLPLTPRAYDDCYEVFNRALADEIGVKVKFRDYGEANFFRLRMNQARKINRQKNAQSYDMDHPMFNASEYDIITLTIESEEDGTYVHAKRRPMPQGIVSLSEPSEAEEVADELGEAVEAPARRV